MPSYLSRITCTKCIPALLTALLLCTTNEYASAEQVSTEAWDISADKVMRYEDPNSIVAQGNVILEKKEPMPLNPPPPATRFTSWSELLEEEKVVPPVVLGEEVKEVTTPQYRTTVTIKADWMVYDVELESIKAKGHVRITTDDDTLTAKEGTLNLSNETGNFVDAVIIRKENDLHLEGQVIEKTGFDTYRITDGWAITCKLENGDAPPWSFASAKTDIRQGGYAVLKHARFNIKGVPVLYSPYLILPVKNTRQTGLLFPEFSSSTNGGFGFNLPLFLNISDSVDATFYPEYYAKRGFMPGLEFRYVASATDKGTFGASYLDDQLSDPSETEYYSDTGYTHDNSDRYWIRGKADHSFGDWQSRLDIDVVSDQDYLNEFNSGSTGFKKLHNRYLNDFGRGFQNQSDTQRQNTFTILNSWDGMTLEANLLAISESNTAASDTNTPLWKLPGINFSGAIPVWTTDFSFDWETNYVNYWREDGVGGHRFDIHPSLSAPIPISAYLETRAEVSVRDTFYMVETYGDGEWQNDDTQNRLYPEFLLETATTLEKDFFSTGNSFRTMAHQIRPYINYGYIPEVDQDELPQFDDVDTVGEKNSISYGIDNFLNKYTRSGQDQENLHNYLEWKLQQSYDLRDTASDEPFSDIFSELTWKPITGANLSYKTYYDVYDNELANHTLEALYGNSRGDLFSLDYSFKESEDIEEINATMLAHLIYGWSVGGEIQHSLSEEETVKASGSLTYQALCWSVKFETHYTPAETTYLMLFNLANIGVPFGIDI